MTCGSERDTNTTFENNSTSRDEPNNLDWFTNSRYHEVAYSKKEACVVVEETRTLQVKMTQLQASSPTTKSRFSHMPTARTPKVTQFTYEKIANSCRVCVVWRTQGSEESTSPPAQRADADSDPILQVESFVSHSNTLQHTVAHCNRNTAVEQTATRYREVQDWSNVAEYIWGGFG